jgi:hypothetical protein
MKTKLQNIFILLFIIISTNKTHSQDISGYWQGVLFQQAGVPVSYFPFSINVFQNGSQITGTSEIRQYNAPQYFGIISFTGSLVDTLLSYQETTIDSQLTNGLWFWCIKNASLTYDSLSQSLSGPWQAPGCNPGTIELYRLATTDTLFCLGQSVSINVTGQNINWYSNANLDTLLWTGNTFNPSITATTTYYVTQTHYNTESPALPITVHIVNCTGINNIQNEGSITIYPNPAKDNIEIKLSDDVGLNSKLHLNVLNALGQIVKEVAINSKLTNINISNLSSGLYFYQLQDDKINLKTAKLIIQ